MSEGRLIALTNQMDIAIQLEQIELSKQGKDKIGQLDPDTREANTKCPVAIIEEYFCQEALQFAVEQMQIAESQTLPSGAPGTPRKFQDCINLTKEAQHIYWRLALANPREIYSHHSEYSRTIGPEGLRRNYIVGETKKTLEQIHKSLEKEQIKIARFRGMSTLEDYSRDITKAWKGQTAKYNQLHPTQAREEKQFLEMIHAVRQF